MVVAKSNNSFCVQHVYFQHFMNLNYKCYNANGEQVIEEGKMATELLLSEIDFVKNKSLNLNLISEYCSVIKIKL